MRCDLILPYLNWPHLISAKCAATGRSHGVLGRLQRTIQFAVAATNHGALSLNKMRSVEIGSDKVRSDELYEHSLTQRADEAVTVSDRHNYYKIS